MALVHPNATVACPYCDWTIRVVLDGDPKREPVRCENWQCYATISLYGNGCDPPTQADLDQRAQDAREAAEEERADGIRNGDFLEDDFD